MTKPDLGRVAALLARHEVECVLVGGQSAIVHGSTRATADVDTVARWTRANLEALCRALDEAGAELRVAIDPNGIEANDLYRRPPGGFEVDVIRHATSFRVRTELGDQIDVLRSIPLEPGPDGARASYDQLLAHAVAARVGAGVEIRVAGLDDVLASKAAVGRTHDLEVVDELRKRHHLPPRRVGPLPQPRPGLRPDEER